jgi:stress response protein YsnF
MISREDVRHVYGTDVYSSEGDKIGSAGQVYLDNDTGEPAWVAVRTGLFGKKESFVPLQDATLDDGRLAVPFSKDKVKNAPRIDQDGELSPADEDELYRYYQAQPADEAARTTDGDAPDRSGDRDGNGNGDGDAADRDDAMTRSEDRLVAGTRTEPVAKARLRKYTVTEEQQVTVPVKREEVRLEHDPAPGAARNEGSAPNTAADDGTAPGDRQADRDADPAMTLWAERPVVTTEAVPVEKVRLGKQTVTGEETVSGEVRKERIELDDDTRQGPSRPVRD